MLECNKVKFKSVRQPERLILVKSSIPQHFPDGVNGLLSDGGVGRLSWLFRSRGTRCLGMGSDRRRRCWCGLAGNHVIHSLVQQVVNKDVALIGGVALGPVKIQVAKLGQELIDLLPKLGIN